MKSPLLWYYSSHHPNLISTTRKTPVMHFLITGFIVKVLQLTVLYFVPYQFDVSLEILIHQYQSHEPKSEILSNILHKFLVWDNIYFTDLFFNLIKYEHQFVFSPGWTTFIKYLSENVMNIDNFYGRLALATVISNLCQFVGSIILYFFSKRVFSVMPFFRNRSRHLAATSSLYYLLSPGGIFLTVLYSENLGSLLLIVGLFMREISIGYDSNYQLKVKNLSCYLLSGFIVSMSFNVRANCLLLGVFYLYDMVSFFVDSNIWDCTISICSGVPLLFNLLYQNYKHYKIFCPERGDWCKYPFPSLFQYCQVHYWNNGFLNYWTLNNAPNFIIAVPIITGNVLAVSKFFKTYPSRNLVPYLILNGLLIIGGVFFWNVQILNRILNFNPIFYWYLAIVDNKYLRYTIIYWIILQSGLFGAFLPPA